ncbi:hypothetical protein [Martelella radicis]|uniref:Uncharacterized protein n=1 Tax=Martelella radicis TaxID=1397476 RepID=A0A7W6KHL2_9HYPH|nr:hypothetical protein [Martelella radicis]MBB4120349.1 hypothetical protein [Martelella radicis]
MDVDACGNQVGLRLLSPLKLARDGLASFEYSALPPGAIDRVEGLAIWQDLKLTCDFGDIRRKTRSIHPKLLHNLLRKSALLKIL